MVIRDGNVSWLSKEELFVEWRSSWKLELSFCCCSIRKLTSAWGYRASPDQEIVL
jgi:hypothetical protein